MKISNILGHLDMQLKVLFLRATIDRIREEAIVLGFIFVLTVSCSSEKSRTCYVELPSDPPAPDSNGKKLLVCLSKPGSMQQGRLNLGLFLCRLGKQPNKQAEA